MKLGRRHVAAAVKLLASKPRRTIRQRWDKAARIVESRYQDPDWLLDFCIASVKHAQINTIVEDVLAFLTEEHMKQLVPVLVARQQEELLEMVGLQFPELVPDSLWGDHFFAYREWLTHADLFNPGPSRHLIFDGGCPLDNARPVDIQHPTWHLPVDGVTAQIGGPGQAVCPSCGYRLMHLITLEGASRPEFVSLPRLVLEICESCWEPAYYQHDDSGMPSRVPPYRVENPDWAHDAAIVPMTVQLASTPPRWARQTWASSQNLFKIGGAACVDSIRGSTERTANRPPHEVSPPV